MPGRVVCRGVPVVFDLGRCEVLACVGVVWSETAATALLHHALVLVAVLWCCTGWYTVPLILECTEL